jgi:hypothetical protein
MITAFELNDNKHFQNIETLPGISKVVSLETERSKHMFMYCHQNTDQNHNVETVNKYLKNMAKVHVFGNDGNKSKHFTY